MSIKESHIETIEIRSAPELFKKIGVFEDRISGFLEDKEPLVGHFKPPWIECLNNMMTIFPNFKLK